MQIGVHQSMNNRRTISLSSLGALAIYLIVGILLLINFPNLATYSNDERTLYSYLILSYFIVVGLVILAIIRHKLYLFEPFSFISILYICIFIYRPIQDLFSHSVSYSGVDLVPFGPKATVIFTAGFIAFYFGYYSLKKSKKISVEKKIDEDSQLVSEDNSETVLEEPLELITDDHPKSITGLVIMWSVFFTCCIICLLSQGFSLRYLFSLGSQGGRLESEGNSVLLFLSNFAISLLVVWLMIIVKSKNTALKILISILTIIYLIMRNGRWLVLIMGLSPFVYYYTKRKKQPRIMWLVVLGSIALVVFSWMQLNRYNIFSGKTLLWFNENYYPSLDVLLAPFDSDFTTYTTFYGMVNKFPEVYPYMRGSTFLYVFTLWIPRVLWPAKPDNPVRDMIEYSLGSRARSAGRAVANLGEYYANFGVVGVIVLMFLFGYIVSKLKNMYEQPTENRLIMYSILYPLMFQWVARGNFSGNFYYTVFAFLPIILQWFTKQINRRSI